MLAEGNTLSERELAGAFGPEMPAIARARGPEPIASRTETPAQLDELEREHIIDVLQQVGGNRMAAAKLLGISRRALYRRLDKHNIVEDAVKRAGGRRHE